MKTAGFRPFRHSLTEPEGHAYRSGFITVPERQKLLSWLNTLHPVWEDRYADKSDRRLLRPVYWMGAWQFACLNYYHPPEGIWDRCVRAEPYPSFVKAIVGRIESWARQELSADLFPNNWSLNTCLINFYGRFLENGKWVDGARVGEHRDFEPGPVASLSLGERALFQFVRTHGAHRRSHVTYQKWLEDRSLQVFGGRTCKKLLFHRVQRVEEKDGAWLSTRLRDFRCRRINITFRFVPEEHILPARSLPLAHQEKVQPYLKELGRHSSFFAQP